MSDVVVVGGGPAGVLLTYLLARGGASVTLLESRHDFARRLRGSSGPEKEKKSYLCSRV